MTTKKQFKKLSIIIPAYNEEKTIKIILERIEAVDLENIEKEIIIVDDGSKDRTREILKEFKNKHKIILHDKNQGKGMALRTGFKEATGDYIVIQDADLEYDPQDFKKMIALAKGKGARVIYGSRRLGPGWQKNPKAGWFYHLGGVFLAWLTNLLYRTRITDEATCYKMFEAKLLKSIDLKCRGFEFCPEITAKVARQGIEIHEISITYVPRNIKEGKKIKFRDGLIAIWTLIKLRF